MVNFSVKYHSRSNACLKIRSHLQLCDQSVAVANVDHDRLDPAVCGQLRVQLPHGHRVLTLVIISDLVKRDFSNNFVFIILSIVSGISPRGQTRGCYQLPQCLLS